MNPILSQIEISAEAEEKGLDLTQIGEQAYDDKLSLKETMGEDAMTLQLCHAAQAGDLQWVCNVGEGSERREWVIECRFNAILIQNPTQSKARMRFLIPSKICPSPTHHHDQNHNVKHTNYHKPLSSPHR